MSSEQMCLIFKQAFTVKPCLKAKNCTKSYFWAVSSMIIPIIRNIVCLTMFQILIKTLSNNTIYILLIMPVMIKITPPFP